MSILIVGDLMIDHWIVGRAQAKICQEAPIPIYDEIEDIYLPGGAGNLAMNVKAMGAEYKLLCANPINMEIAEEDINCTYTQTESISYKNRLVCDDYLISRWDHNYILTKKEAADYQKMVLDNMNDYTTMIITDYNKGAVNNELFLSNIVRKFKGNIVMDPYSGRNIEWYKWMLTWCDSNLILVPNDKEMDTNMIEELLGWCKCSIVMKCGNMGCVLYTIDSEIHYPSVATTVRSVVGAGDVCVAAIGVCIDKGRSLEQACNVAMICAANAITKPLTCVTDIRI